MKKISLLSLVAAAMLLVVSPASAQKRPNVITIGEVTIVGRVQKPYAVADVAPINVKIELNELRQPFLDRIDEAVRKDPF